MIDVLQMKQLSFPSNGGTAVVSEIPESEKAKAEELHNTLIENAAENDESLMEKFFEEGTLTEEEIKKGLHLGILNGSTFPVLCTAAKTDQGVLSLMDFIKDNCPVPNEAAFEKTKNGKVLGFDVKEAASAFVFKAAIEQHLGEVSFMKIYNASLPKPWIPSILSTAPKKEYHNCYA